MKMYYTDVSTSHDKTQSEIIKINKSSLPNYFAQKMKA